MKRHLFRHLMVIALCLVLVTSLVVSSCKQETTTTPTTVTGTAKPTATTVAPTNTVQPTIPLAPTVEPSGKPIYGGVRTFAYTTDPPKLNPIQSSTQDNRFLPYEVSCTIDISRGPAGTKEWNLDTTYFPYEFYVGHLCESWETNDFQTVTMHVRKGVHFNNKPPANGREIKAADFVFCIKERETNPLSSRYKPPSTPADQFIKTEVIDNYTFKFTLPTPFTNPINPERIYPPENLTNIMADWRNNCGTGPYELVQWTNATSIVMQKNQDYWGMDPLHPENRLPYNDTINYINIPDPSTRLSALRTHKIDGLETSVTDATNIWETNPELLWRSTISTTNFLVILRQDLPEFQDIRVRKALTLAIDRKSLLNDYLKGFGVLFNYPFSITIPEPIYTPFDTLPDDIKELYEYNPTKAKQLLAEAGYPNGLTIELLTTNASTYAMDYASLIKNWWDSIGVTTTLSVLETSTYNSKLRGRTYKQAALTSGQSTSPYYAYGTHYQTGNVWNYSLINDPYLDAEYKNAQAMLDEHEEYAKLKELSYYMLRQCYLIPLPVEQTISFSAPWYKGWETGGTAWVDMDLKRKLNK